MSLELFVSYAFVAIFIIVIMVLFCRSCQCSVPLRKIWIWCFSQVSPSNRGGGEARVKRSQDKQARSMESDYAKCFGWVPFVLTCGYCFGACKDEMNPTAPIRRMPAVVAQPVSDPPDEPIGTEPIVAVHMPLLP